MGKENLKPVRTTEEARERGRAGGIQSGISRREKRIMTDIYKDFLRKKHETVEDAIAKVVKRGDSSSVSMMREIRESTEGITHNINIDTDLDTMRKKLIETINKLNGNSSGNTDTPNS